MFRESSPTYLANFACISVLTVALKVVSRFCTKTAILTGVVTAM